MDKPNQASMGKAFYGQSYSRGHENKAAKGASCILRKVNISLLQKQASRFLNNLSMIKDSPL